MRKLFILYIFICYYSCKNNSDVEKLSAFDKSSTIKGKWLEDSVYFYDGRKEKVSGKDSTIIYAMTSFLWMDRYFSSTKDHIVTEKTDYFIKGDSIFIGKQKCLFKDNDSILYITNEHMETHVFKSIKGSLFK